MPTAHTCILAFVAHAPAEAHPTPGHGQVGRVLLALGAVACASIRQYRFGTSMPPLGSSKVVKTCCIPGIAFSAGGLLGSSFSLEQGRCPTRCLGKSTEWQARRCSREDPRKAFAVYTAARFQL